MIQREKSWKCLQELVFARNSVLTGVHLVIFVSAACFELCEASKPILKELQGFNTELPNRHKKKRLFLQFSYLSYVPSILIVSPWGHGSPQVYQIPHHCLYWCTTIYIIESMFHIPLKF